jgi:glycosyltransferase involved in cell wall biosynthesis
MRILRVHNYYQQPGGEDQSFAAEIALLEQHGHEVIRFTVHNDAINSMGRLEVAGKTLWNREMYKQIAALIAREKPEIAHFENTFPLISPAAYYATQRAGLPVVQSLRNYRLFCADAYFYRQGRVCEECLGKMIPWPALHYRCYRDSFLATGVVTSMQVLHRSLHTWARQVDRFIALTEFGRRKFVEGGIAPEKIVVKPNFLVRDPGLGEGSGDYALFVGRLSAEKGIVELLKSWEALGSRLLLKLVGSGPLAPMVAEAASAMVGVEWLGQQPPEEVAVLMGAARLLIFPSLWYEGFPRVIVEAFARGLPVVASNLGSMASLIEHRRTGLHFHPGDTDDLAAQVTWALDRPQELERMRREARTVFEAAYTADRNYHLLMQIYLDCLQAKRVA